METADRRFMRSVLSNKKVFDMIGEDWMRPDDINPAKSSLCLKHGEHGYIEFRPLTRHSWEAHICMLPKAKNVDKFGMQCLLFAAQNRAKVVYSTIPAYNRAARLYVKKLGFEKTGVIPESFLKNGKMHDIEIWSFKINL